MEPEQRDQFDIDQEVIMPSCPVGKSDCDWLKEINELRDQLRRLEQMVSVDGLTGLYNYRYFEQILHAEMQRTLRGGRPTSIIMVDIDFFKQVNDQYGHEAGNRVLKHLARLFKDELREFDSICRYGGEEFVVILPQTVLPLAVRIAGRLRHCVEQQEIEIGDQQSINVTASFGVNVFQSGSTLDMEAFVQSADHFLYQAKEQGRNQVGHPDFAAIASYTSVSADEKSELFGNND